VIRPAALALFVSYWSLSAHAQAPDDVAVRAVDQGLVQSGLSAYQRHDYSAALTLLKRASFTAPSLTVRLYLARSRAQLGQLVAAADDYRSVVSASETAANTANTRSLIESEQDELAQLRPRIPSVEITLGDAEQRSHNLRLVLDGRLITYSAPIAVDPGHHEVIASDADGEQSRRCVEVGEVDS